MKATPKKITPLVPHDFKTVVEVTENTYIYLHPQVLRDLQTIIHLTSMEIGILGLVKRHKNNIFEVYELILPKQEISGGTCELTPDGMGEIAEQLIANRPEEYNNLRLWAHSHHTMGISPSAQDNTQWHELANNCNDYFIRAICNHKGDLKFDINLISEGIQVIDVPWAVIQTGDNRQEHWIKEFEEKCSQISYTNQNNWDWRNQRAADFEPTAHAKRMFAKGWRTNPTAAIAKNSLMRKTVAGYKYKTVSSFIWKDIKTLERRTTSKLSKEEISQEAMDLLTGGWEPDPHSNFKARKKYINGGFSTKEIEVKVYNVLESLFEDWDDYLADTKDVEKVARQNIADAEDQQMLPGMEGFVEIEDDDDYEYILTDDDLL